jgi:NAD(P)-dependent dehydrogenase (short-subunit alcohol dehydrogenase family)
VIDAVGNPQTILLLGGTSEIGLAICERYLRDAPARIILAALPDELLGAITALNLVERLPLERLLTLLEEGRRTLISGGVLLLTTADADEAARRPGAFHEDPRRRQPVPLVQLSFLVEKAGFSQLDSFLLPAPLSGPAEIALVAIKT